MFDNNNDGKVSYQELCRYFSEVSSVKAVTDFHHWAFYIFETIRRYCDYNKKSLKEVFGLTNYHF